MGLDLNKGDLSLELGLKPFIEDFFLLFFIIVSEFPPASSFYVND